MLAHTDLIAVSFQRLSSAGCFPAESASASPDDEMESGDVGIVKVFFTPGRRFLDHGIRQDHIVVLTGEARGVPGPTEGHVPVQITRAPLATLTVVEAWQSIEGAHSPDHELVPPDADNGPPAHLDLRHCLDRAQCPRRQVDSRAGTYSRVRRRSKRQAAGRQWHCEHGTALAVRETVWVPDLQPGSR